MLATLIQPSVLVMRRLRLAGKFSVVALAFLVPLLFLLATVVIDRYETYAFTRKEVLGLDAIATLTQVVEPSARWRGNTLGASAQVAGAVEARQKASLEVDAALAAFQNVVALGDDPLKLRPVAETLGTQWRAAKASPLGSPADSFEQANQWVAAVRHAIETITDQSNLSLDPDADTYFLMLAHTSELPALMDFFGRTRAIGRFLAHQGRPDDAEMFMALHNADALTELFLQRTQRALAKAATANSTVAPHIDLALAGRIEAQVVARIDKEFAWGEVPKADPAEWFATTSSAIKLLDNQNKRVGEQLERLLHAREARLQTALWSAVAVAILFIGLAAYLLLGFYAAAVSSFSALGRRIASLGLGDLSDTAPLSGQDELAEAGNKLRDATTDLSMLVLQVRASAEEIAGSVLEIAAGNQDLAHRGAQMAAVVEQTSASTATLESAVEVNLASAQEAHDLVQGAAQVAGRGGAVVEQAVEAMNQITASSKKIGDIIQVIDTIAFQTNILALNAAVEAARAGEQGRGFAVVAGEVRALAQRSAGAAREIKTLIQSSIDTVQTGGQHVNEAGQTMTEMVGAIERMTVLMGDITRQSNTQAQQIRELGSAIREVDTATQQNAALVEQTAATASALSDRARSLSEVAAQFKTAC
jgi:methyl-accepting chemotaxis protein